MSIDQVPGRAPFQRRTCTLGVEIWLRRISDLAAESAGRLGAVPLNGLEPVTPSFRSLLTEPAEVCRSLFSDQCRHRAVRSSFAPVPDTPETRWPPGDRRAARPPRDGRGSPASFDKDCAGTLQVSLATCRPPYGLGLGAAKARFRLSRPVSGPERSWS